MRFRLPFFLTLTALLCPSVSRAAPPAVTRWTLDNGMRVLVLHYEKSEHCAIFSLLPLGLGADAADRTQWSHLVEHLTLRTTGPITDYRERNAETMPSGMHLDWMGASAKWEEGLDLQAKWLTGLPFQEKTLREEVPKAVSEVDFTVPKGFTHKWAFAAWTQVVRHGRERVDVRGAIEKASLADVALYRDQHLVIPERTLLCIAGGISAETLRPALAERIGKIQTQAKALPTASAPAKATGELRAEWDLQARHILFSWPISSPGTPGYAALHMASQALAIAAATDPELQGRKAPVLTSVETISPESSFFIVSTPTSDPEDSTRVRRRVAYHLGKLRDGTLPNFSMLPMGLAAQLSPEAMDPAIARSQGVPSQVTDAMLEANIALQRAILEWRHKDPARFAADLKALTAKDITSAVRTHLSDQQATTLLLEPHGG